MSKIIKFEIPFKSKNYEKNCQTYEKAFYKGHFIITMDLEYELILNTTLKLEELGIDVFNTCDWFLKDKNKKNKEDEFNLRKKFLSLSNIDIRPRFYQGTKNKTGCIDQEGNKTCLFSHKEKKLKNQNQIIHFSKQKEIDLQLIVQFEMWFNDYKISFKGLDKIATGSNPSGSVKKSMANPLVLNTNDPIVNHKYHNFAFILEKARIDKKNAFDVSSTKDKKTYSFLEIINSKKIFFLLEKIFSFSNQIPYEKKKSEVKKFRNTKRDAEMDYTKTFEIMTLVKKARTKFSTNMDKILKDKQDISLLISEYERCHIKPVTHIKKNMFNSYMATKNLNQAKVMAQEIASANNGIFLTPNHHNLFDRGESYIDPNDGKMYFAKNTKRPKLVIKQKCLNKERKNFLIYHKEYIYGRGIRKN